MKNLSKLLLVVSFLSAIAEATIVCEGRLSLQSAAVSSAGDLINKTTLYFSPYEGTALSLYENGSWKQYQLEETTLSLTPDAKPNMTFDIFGRAYNGRVYLETSSVWTSDNFRRDALVAVDGFLVDSRNPARRYLGTVRLNALGLLEDSKLRRFVWSQCNREIKVMEVAETTNVWGGGDGFLPVNNQAKNRVEFVIGDFGSHVDVDATLLAKTPDITRAQTNFALDNTRRPLARDFGMLTVTAHLRRLWAKSSFGPQIGYHYIQWLQHGDEPKIPFYGTLPGITPGKLTATIH